MTSKNLVFLIDPRKCLVLVLLLKRKIKTPSARKTHVTKVGPCNEKKRKKRKNDTERHQGESVVRQNAQGSRNGNCSTQLAREKR